MNIRTQIHLFLIVLILGFLTGPRVIQALQKIGGTDEATATTTAVVPALKQEDTPVGEAPVDHFATLPLEAKAVFVWDVYAHKKLYGVNEHAILPLASLTKMMMAVVAKEELDSSATVTIRPSDLLQDGDTGLLSGEVWRFEDLLAFTLVASSNDGASAIASVAGASLSKATATPAEYKRFFIEKMNEKARIMGLSRTQFYNESGLDLESLASGAHGSARDMAMLFEYIFRKYPELFTPTAYASTEVTSESKVVHHVANTNQSVKYWSGMIGSKTGYTTLAGGNLVVIVDIGIDHPVVVAVLGSTYDGRFKDVEQLIDATVRTIAGNTPGAK